MSSQTLEWLFDLAIGWEAVVRDLYATMARRFPKEPGVSRFFQELSEGSRHVEILQEARCALSSDELSTPLNDEELEIVRQAGALLKRSRYEEAATLDDAYEAARELENSEINLIFRMLTEKSFAGLDRQGLILAEMDEHLERFERFGQQFNVAFRRLIPITRAATWPA